MVESRRQRGSEQAEIDKASAELEQAHLDQRHREFRSTDEPLRCVALATHEVASSVAILEHR